MHTRRQSIAPLMTVILLAVALTAAMSGAALARSTFQSSPVLPTETPVLPPPAATATATASATSTGALPQIPTETPTESAVQPPPDLPLPTPTQPLIGSPVPQGFLPAPTLTNPDALLVIPSAPRPPVSDASEPAPESLTAAAEVPSAAQIIDNGILALSYVWLCCGALLLGLLALMVVWLARRGPRR